MDPDRLADEVDQWVQDDIITESQAEAILQRYDTEATGRSRVVVALSVVGAALVFVGVALFFATRWAALPTLLRGAVLVAAPSLAYAGGVVGYRRGTPRVGLALCLLGATLVGPSLFLLGDLFSVTFAEQWLLFAWSLAAVSTGHLLVSRVGVGLGLALVTALVAVLADPGDPLPPVAFFGIAVFGLASINDGRIARTYRLVGVVVTLAGLLGLTTLDGRFDRFDVGPTVFLFVTAAAALTSADWLLHIDAERDFEWATGAFLAVVAATALAVAAPGWIPSILAFAGIHAAMLAAVLATGYLGYRTGSRTLVDIATVAALAQTLSAVASTVVDSLSGAVALVAAGVVLLAAGVAIERGRRSVLSRLG